MGVEIAGMTTDYRTPYAQRAGVNERPPLFVEPSAPAFAKAAALLRRAVSPYTVFADISEFQPVISDAYEHPMVSFRADTGWRLDNHAWANWNYVKHASHIEVALSYVVFIPGQNAAILSRLKSLFGSTCPNKLAIMVDMESGYGFAGPGNHSWEANQLLDELVAWTGSRAKVVAYANGYDFASCWPTAPSWVKKITASYGTQDPGTWGWQYFGGMSQYSSPYGMPRSSAPFGSWVDMNVVHRTLAQIKSDLGMTSKPVTPVIPKPVVTPPVVVPVPHPVVVPPKYTVRSGDTLGAIASRFHTTVAVLAKLNHIRDVNVLHIGQVLILPGGSKPVPHVVKYRVQSGDTLASIAVRYHTTVAQLVKWNAIHNPNVIQVGWVLRVA